MRAIRSPASTSPATHSLTSARARRFRIAAEPSNDSALSAAISETWSASRGGGASQVREITSLAAALIDAGVGCELLDLLCLRGMGRQCPHHDRSAIVYPFDFDSRH